MDQETEDRLAQRIADMLETSVPFPTDEDIRKSRYEWYLKTTKDFLQVHDKLIQEGLLQFHYSPEIEDLVYRFHWVVGMKAIVRARGGWDLTGHCVRSIFPTREWVQQLIDRVDEPDLPLDPEYFFKWARTMVEAYYQWFEETLKEDPNLEEVNIL